MTSFAIAATKVIASIRCYVVKNAGHHYKLPTVNYDFNKRNLHHSFPFHCVILSCFIVTVQLVCLNVIL